MFDIRTVHTGAIPHISLYIITYIIFLTMHNHKNKHNYNTNNSIGINNNNNNSYQ